MANVFDPQVGYEEKTLENIQSEKAQNLETKIGFPIDTTAESIWSVLNNPSSLVDLETNQIVGLIITQFISFISNTQNQVSIPASSTMEAILSRSADIIPNLEYISIDDPTVPDSKRQAGEIKIYYIFGEPHTHLEYQVEIWQAIHKLKDAGVMSLGDYSVSGSGSNGQIFQYFYSLGVRKYVYIIVEYAIDSTNYIVGNTDSTFKEIYQKVVDTNYRKISRDLHYQDFTIPTEKIQGIARTDFYYYISPDPNLIITNIPISDFSLNVNTKVSVSDVLIFDFGNKILIRRAES